MLLHHDLLVHQCIYGTVPFQSLTRCHTRIRSRSRTREKALLTQVQFIGLFNKTITPITRSTKRREGINPSENALKPQLIRLQLHIM